MIVSSRLWFYSITATLSTFLFLLGSYRRIDDAASESISGSNAHLLSPLRSHVLIDTSPPNSETFVPQIKTTSQYKPRSKPVIAPWTKLMQKDGSTYPRSFVFSEIDRLDDYGLKVRKFDEEQRSQVKKQMQSRLCARSKKFANSKYEANKCNQQFNLLKCTSCSEIDGSWYSASSFTGAVFAKIDDKTNLHYPYYNDGPYSYQQLDIAVPISGQDEKLKAFAQHLGSSVKKFREGLQGNRIAIRLLITRFKSDSFESDEEMQALQNELTKKAQLERPGDSVEFVSLEETTFSRAKAVNALHAVACHREDCVLACTDVDMNISSPFLRHSLIFPFPGAAAYFPIMWSEFNPETVNLADQFLTESAKWKYTDHHGYWRKSSYGMYVIAGSDAKRLSMDESFIGWGGEDNDFYGRVSDTLNIVRMKEKGLTHMWHAKDCKLGSFVENDFFKACIGAKAHTEGSQLGLYLRSLQLSDPEMFEQLVQVQSTKIEAEGHQMEEAVDDSDVEKVSVLVAVISSRANLKSRVSTIMKTWGEPGTLPEGITLRFFVGAMENAEDGFSGSTVDIENLSREAGVRDLSMIQVMGNVQDDEYPPVRKNAALIRYLDELVTNSENDATAASTFQWIFKVDDDAYVNFDGLLKFVQKRNSAGYHVFGERGYGRPEDLDGLSKGRLVQPYCTGGPGYVMSRPTLKKTATGMEQCVKEADDSQYREYLWHSDVVIGMCIQKQTGAGCWSDDDYDKKRIFRNNHQKEYPFINDSKLEWMVSMHPFKEEASMIAHHKRYQALGTSTK